MQFPTLLTLLILFILFMTMRLKTNNLKERRNSSRFWEREQEANLTKKQCLDSLPYIQIPLEILPMLDTEDSELLEHQKAIERLAGQKIVNLTGIPNTELKLQHGAQNLDVLSNYDQNFTFLCRELYSWAQILYNKGLITEAITVLDFGITCHTDVSGHYLLLAKLYKETYAQHKLQVLIETADQVLPDIMKPTIISKLQGMVQTEES